VEEIGPNRKDGISKEGKIVVDILCIIEVSELVPFIRLNSITSRSSSCLNVMRVV